MRRLLCFLNVVLSLLARDVFADEGEGSVRQEPIRAGWIGPMTGPGAKYGSYQAAQLALEDINRKGGIKGRPFELIFEDGKGASEAAVSAAMKLINQDHVRYFIGGHCSPESIPLAPTAARNKVLMFAAVTSSPKLQFTGEWVFRLTPLSLVVAQKLVPYAMEQLGLRRFAALFAETDYARPPAEEFRRLVNERNGEMSEFVSFSGNDTDFRTQIARMKVKGVEAVYIGSQFVDTTTVILQQMNDLGFHPQILGNESTGNAVATAGERRPLYEGLIYGEPAFDVAAPNVRDFVERYKSRYGGEGLPYGIWTAEAYDTVRVLAQAIDKCGEAAEDVKRCLLEVKNYKGISGTVGIDSHGNGVREYALKRIKAGRSELLFD